MSHLRILPKMDALAIVCADLGITPGEITPDVLDAARTSMEARYGCRYVGETADAFVLDVAGEPTPDMPGSVLPGDYDTLPDSLRPYVLDAVYEAEDAPGARIRCKVAQVPEGLTPLEAYLHPHRWL